MKFYNILTIFLTLNSSLSFKLPHVRLQRNIKTRIIPDMNQIQDFQQISSNINDGSIVAAQETLNKVSQYPNLLQVIIQETFFIFNNFVLPALLLFSVLNVFNSRMGMGMNPLSQNKKINKFDPVKQNITMNSWVGSPEVFEECFEVISYLKNEEDYKALNIELPKGILLEGPPGTGKTLLAKAIASETSSNFISISGSEFVELIVGMGALKVRELFKEARQNKPCIIFIDEIDAIGKKRSTGFSSNDEREQTLNQILSEMDGFEDNEGLTILAATNRKDILDEALIRPGRFDRIIKIGLPDKTSREQILKFYLDKKPVEDSIDIKSLSEVTDGMSGAEIKNLVNEAAICAVRNGEKIISRKNIDDAYEKLIVGLIRNTDTRTNETLYRVAVHEIGHAIVVLLYNKYFDMFKVSIKATYNGAGGYTLFSEKPEFKDGGLYTKALLFKRLIIALGGKAAETVFFGDEFVSGGASQDLNQANGLARQMIENYGMGDKLKVFHNNKLDGQYSPDMYSDTTKKIIDEESLSLVNMAFDEAVEIIKQEKPYIELLINSLLDKKILFMNDIELIKHYT